MVWYVCTFVCIHTHIYIYIHTLYAHPFSWSMAGNSQSKNISGSLAPFLLFITPSSITIQQPTFKSLKWDLSRHPFPIVAPSPQKTCTQNSIYMILSLFLNIFFTTSHCNSEVSQCRRQATPCGHAFHKDPIRGHRATGSWLGENANGRTEENTTMWVCLKMLCTPKPNGFADHYPY